MIPLTWYANQDLHTFLFPKSFKGCFWDLSPDPNPPKPKWRFNDARNELSGDARYFEWCVVAVRL